MSRTHGHLLDHVVGCAKADLQTSCESDGLACVVSIDSQNGQKDLLQVGSVVQWQLCFSDKHDRSTVS